MVARGPALHAGISGLHPSAMTTINLQPWRVPTRSRPRVDLAPTASQASRCVGILANQLRHTTRPPCLILCRPAHEIAATTRLSEFVSSRCPAANLSPALRWCHNTKLTSPCVLDGDAAVDP